MYVATLKFFHEEMVFMSERFFDLQRFATDAFSLTDDEKKKIRNSSLPHLRMLITVAKNPAFKRLTDALEAGEDTINFVSRDVAPLFTFIAALYKRKLGKNAKLHLIEDAAICTSSIKIIDQILEVYDACADFDRSKLPLNLSKKLTSSINEALNIANSIGKKGGEDGFFLAVVTSSLSYGISLLSTLDGMTPEEQVTHQQSVGQVRRRECQATCERIAQRQRRSHRSVRSV
jgi:hypothetical protein